MSNMQPKVTEPAVVFIANIVGMAMTLCGIALIVFSIIALINGMNNKPSTGSSTQPCTKEAKICPDGSSVARSGYNCEFAACPDAPQATKESM